MADPLSITAGIVAVVGAAGGITKTLGKIKDLRNAPDELLALINEVSDLRLILNDLQHYILQNTQRQQILQEELHSYQSRIGFTIDQIHVISGQLQSNHHLFSGRTSQQLNEHSRLLTSISSSQSTLQDLFKLQPSATIRAHYSTDVGERSPSSIIYIRAYTSQQSPCTSYCTCACHKVQTFQSPALLHKAIGTLFVGYYEYPIMRPSNCTDNDCLSQSSFRTYVHYLFPFWVLAKALILTLASGSLDKTSISLTIRRIVSPGAEIFRLARLNDVEGLKRLFSKGLASSNDSLSDGIQVLSDAVSGRKLKACKFLLQAEADPHLESFVGGRSAFEQSWNIILAASGDQAVLETLRNLFPDKDSSLEEHQFSTLYKIILDITSRNLKEELAICGSNIDRIDSDGDTALMWAARKGDSKGVNLILKANGNPNLVNRFNVAPLLYTARISDPTCAKLLLKGGADPHHVDDQNYNALHWAAEYQNGREMIECLIAAGVDVNKRTIWGATPLTQVTFHNYAISAEALLDYGADPNVLDCERDTPLIESIYHNADNTTQLLLHRGATYISSNVYGDTILHQAALCGGLKTLSILQTAELKGIDPDATNDKRKTAIQIAREREDKPYGFIPQFQDLLAGIRIRNASLDAASREGSGPVNSQSTSGDRAYLGYLAKWVRLPWGWSIDRRNGRRWTPRLSTAILHPWIRWGPRVFWAHWVLGLCCAGLAYLYLNFVPDGRMRWLGMLWDILEPGGFEEV